MNSIDATIVAIDRLSPRVCRLSLHSSSLGQLAAELRPADAVKVGLPDGLERAYTLRAVDVAAGTFSLDVVLHDVDAPGVRWATRSRVGDRLTVRGPAYGYTIDDTASAFVLAGDDTALPAIAEIARAVRGRASVTVVAEVADVHDRIDIDAQVHWIHRDGDAPGLGHRLLDAVRGMTWPRGEVRVWVAGETGVARALRHHIRVERAVPRPSARFAGYWRRGLTWEGVAPVEDEERRRFAAAGGALHDVHDIDDYDPDADGTPRL